MRRRKSPSRLVRTSERQNKKQAIIFAIGTIVIIVLLVQFGPILVNVFGNVVYTLRGGDDADKNQLVGNALLQPPTLLGISSATQSATILFSGIAPASEGTIEIFLNDELEEEIELDNSTDFSVELSLEKGQNSIKARFSKDNKTSPFSDEYQVHYTTERPDLEIPFPQDNQTFTKADRSITITGTTEPENVVTINSFRAIVEPDGSFGYLIHLNDGENHIIVEAINPAGASTQKSLKVIYQP